jgi:hypothetical protein
LDSEKLAGDDAKKLSKLVDQSGILNESKLEKLKPGACDVFYYSITVKPEAGDSKATSTHSVKFDDITLPSQYRPLVEFLQKRSQNLKQR